MANRLAAAAVLLVLMPLTVLAVSGCSTCADVTTGLPFNPPSWRPATCPMPVYNSRTGVTNSWNVPVGSCCGPSPQKPCPSIACSAAFSYSSSGPGQCAKSYSTIAAATVSKTQYKTAYDWAVPVLTTYCQSSPPTYGQVTSTAAAIANVYAEAVATTLIYHSQFVCLNKFQGGSQCSVGCATCNGGKAYSSVKADVQAVATAAADSLAALFLQVNDANGDPLAISQGLAQSFATAINTAVDTYFNELSLGASYAPTAAACTSSGPTTQAKTAIAQALSCAFVRVFATIYVAYPVDDVSPDQITPDSQSCSNSYAASYSIGSTAIRMYCPDIDCPLGCAAPGTQVAVANPNFSANTGFTGAVPNSWSVQQAVSGSIYHFGNPDGFFFGSIGPDTPSSDDIVSQVISNLKPSCQYKLQYDWFPTPSSRLDVSVNNVPVYVDNNLYDGSSFFPSDVTATIAFGGRDIPSFGKLTNIRVVAA